MAMKVYGVDFSPFVQRVLLAARLKGHELPTAPLPGGGFDAPEFAAISPMRRIPVLDDDGWTLAESAAIVDYLDEVLDGPALLPANPRERARALMIERIVEQEVAPGARPFMVTRVFAMRPEEPAITDAARAQIDAGLDALERARTPADVYAVGAAPSRVDAVLTPVLALWDMIDPVVDSRAQIAARPGLAAYFAMAERDPILGAGITTMRSGFMPTVEQAVARIATA
jgi:glutathione S-transferase